MHSKMGTSKLDVINNRILVRNSHKFVYKKLCNLNRDQWCQKYLSVATSKLLDPKNTTKLPFSLNKKHRTQGSLASASNTSFGFTKKRSQVLAIHDSQQLQKSRTIDNDALIQASRKAEKLLERMKQTVLRPQLKVSNKTRCRLKSPKRHRQKDQFDIEPWMVEIHDPEDKENRFF